jgi:hypothetical protein
MTNQGRNLGKSVNSPADPQPVESLDVLDGSHPRFRDVAALLKSPQRLRGRDGRHPQRVAVCRMKSFHSTAIGFTRG